MNFTSFKTLTPDERVAALNRVFEGYVLPFKMSDAQFTLHVRTNDVDLSASPVIIQNGEIAAAALVAIRNGRSWIGGFGVSPAYRGRGMGRRLLERCFETVNERAATEMQLEVLQHNPAAIALYESAGFKRMRELDSFRVMLGQHDPADVKEATIQTLLQSAAQSPPCWQREATSLLNQPQLYGFLSSHGAAAIRTNGSVGQLSFISSETQQDFYELMEGIATYCGIDNLVVFNEPADSSICTWSREAAWPVPFKQYEMHIRL